MIRVRGHSEVEARAHALEAAAELARSALGCLFSSSQEFEAALIRQRFPGAASAAARVPRNHLLRRTLTTIALAFAFLML